MVNTGKPSGACRTCLTKRIKCDETKPQCRKCLKNIGFCSGYRSSNELTFRDQNAYAAAKVLSRRANQPSSQPQPPKSSQPHLNLLPPHPSSPPSSSHLITSTAVEHFAQDYALGAQPSTLFSTLTTQWSRNALHPSLLAALPAVSLANAYTRTNAPSHLAAARHRYGAALARVGTALTHHAHINNRSRDGQLLLALILLNLFEMMAGDVAGNGQDLHYAGKVALLRLRGEEGLADDDGRVLFRMVFAQVCVADLRAGRMPPREGRRWLDALWREGGGYVADKVVEMEWEVAVFCARAGEVVEGEAGMKAGKKAGKRLQELLVEGEELLDRLERWAEGEGEQWQFERKTVVGPKRKGEDKAGWETVHVYFNLVAATNWNFNRALRISLANTLLRLAGRMQAVDPVFKLLTGVRQSLWKQTTLELADDICESMPFILADHRQNAQSRSTGAAVLGYQCLWPLRVASTVDGIKVERRSELMDWNGYIAYQLGFREAMA